MNEYVRRLTSYVPGSPVESMTATGAKVQQLGSSIVRDGKLDVAYGPGKWTAREILCHLADVEMVIGFRMRQVIANENHLVQPMDENAWAKAYKAADATAALASLGGLREWNLAFLKALPGPSWEKPYRHPEQGDLKFDTLIRLLAGHDVNHIGQLETIAR
jgi:hypothetical protein